MRRQLEDYASKRRREVKNHVTPSHGRVAQLLPEDDYGMIRTSDGRELYFHRNSVLNADFDRLQLDAEVRFSEAVGDLGPRASAVTLVGKHHIVA